MNELPVLTDEPFERADAARNRTRLLAAAVKLFEERGAGCVSMDEVAAAAGVGKGTLFRRFGDRAGLALALLDEHERELQERILRGPPPLGPGAPQRERLLAFLAALAELTFEHRDLLLEVERAPAARYHTGAYQAWLQHTVLLLGDDDGLRAHLLLAPLAADLVWHLAEDEGVSPADLVRGLHDLAGRLAR